MKRPLLLLPLLALAAVPCLAQDPATNAVAAEAAQTNAVPLRWGVVPFPDGFALFDRFVELVHAPPRYDLAGIGFGWYDKARDAYGAQLDILLASAENVRGVSTENRRRMSRASSSRPMSAHTPAPYQSRSGTYFSHIKA